MVTELILVDAETCRPLRASILRPGQAPERSVYPLDDDPRTSHFAMKKGRRVLGVASLFHDTRPEGGERWRLRGMAVLAEQRGQGLGSVLMRAVQAIAANRGGGLWCNARTSAQGFYSRHGCATAGEEFEDPDLGPHVVMTWWPGESPPDPE